MSMRGCALQESCLLGCDPKPTIATNECCWLQYFVAGMCDYLFLDDEHLLIPSFLAHPLMLL